MTNGPARNSMMETHEVEAAPEQTRCLCADGRRSSPQEQIVSRARPVTFDNFRVSMAR